MDEALVIAAGSGIAARGGRGASPRSGDDVLVAGARAGSTKAITALVHRHWSSVHRTAYLIVGDSSAAEDVAQESMLAALAALDRFDETRRIGPWLNRIAVNNALKWIRSATRRREVSAELVDLEGSADGTSAHRQISDELLTALRALEPDQRAVVVLRYLLDCTPGEIAEVLDVPRGTVNSRLRRALDRLGAELGEVFP